MSKSYFISGHLDISEEEFTEHYKDHIDSALQENATFVIGDAKGVDTLAQAYLFKNNASNVTIYHMFKKPLNNVGKFKTNGGYKNHNEKDSAMTYNSDIDIAWVRSVKEQKKLYGNKYVKRKSGTEKNINRRKKLNNNF